MLDVSFFFTKPRFEKPIVYRMRTEFFRASMTSFLNAGLKAIGAGPLGDPRDSEGFFPTTAAIDLKPSFGRSTPSVVQHFIDSFGSSRCVIFAASTHRLFKHPDWNRAETHFTIIDEVTVESRNIPLIVTYLDQHSPLGSKRKVDDFEEFHAYFGALVKSSDPELPDFVQAFNETMAVHVDAKTLKFTRPSPILGASSDDRSTIFKLLRTGFRNRCGPNLPTTIVRCLSLLHRNEAPAGAFAQLCRLVAQDLERTDAAKQTAYHPDRLFPLIRAGVLLAFARSVSESSANLSIGHHPDPGLFSIYQMLVDLDWRISRFNVDPLKGLWRSIEAAVFNASADRNLVELIKATATTDLDAVDVDWVTRLKELCARSPYCDDDDVDRSLSDRDVEKVDATHADQALAFPEPLFNAGGIEIVLNRRFLSGDHYRPLILHGPAGSGKTTAAYVYAMALSCNKPREGFMPCFSCPDCRELSQSSLDLIHFDAGTIDARKGAKDLRRSLQVNSFSGRFVTVIYSEHRCFTTDGGSLCSSVLRHVSINKPSFFALPT